MNGAAGPDRRFGVALTASLAAHAAAMALSLPAAATRAIRGS